MEKLDIKAALFVSKIDLSIEYPKISEKLSNYVHDMQIRAYKAGYEEAKREIFNLMQEMAAKINEKKQIK